MSFVLCVKQIDDLEIHSDSTFSIPPTHPLVHITHMHTRSCLSSLFIVNNITVSQHAVYILLYFSHDISVSILCVQPHPSMTSSFSTVSVIHPLVTLPLVCAGPSHHPICLYTPDESNDLVGNKGTGLCRHMGCLVYPCQQTVGTGNKEPLPEVVDQRFTKSLKGLIRKGSLKVREWRRQEKLLMAVS